MKFRAALVVEFEFKGFVREFECDHDNIYDAERFIEEQVMEEIKNGTFKDVDLNPRLVGVEVANIQVVNGAKDPNVFYGD